MGCDELKLLHRLCIYKTCISLIAGGCTTEKVDIDNVRSLRNSDFEETARLENMKVRELRTNELAKNACY